VAVFLEINQEHRMSQSADKDQDGTQKKPSTAEPARPAARESRILLVPYPKFIFLYPTFFAAVLAAIWMTVTGRHTVSPDDMTAVAITWTFLAVLGVNVVVLAFDFPRTTSLTMFFFLAALTLGAILAFTLRPQILPAIGAWIRPIRPVANSTFYYVVVVVMALVYAAVLISLRFDYWEVRQNELLHHHGFLSGLKRYAAPNLRIDKEINDVFEYMLLGSGRLILRPAGERDIILDNVPFINKKEKAITLMLGALQVEVRPDST
jgi:hypothetical protein